MANKSNSRKRKRHSNIDESCSDSEYFSPPPRKKRKLQDGHSDHEIDEIESEIGESQTELSITSFKSTLEMEIIPSDESQDENNDNDIEDGFESDNESHISDDLTNQKPVTKSLSTPKTPVFNTWSLESESVESILNDNERFWAILIANDADDESVPFTKDRYCIGRDHRLNQNDVILCDEAVSGKHCNITRQAQSSDIIRSERRHYLVDTSTNGTRVNGRRIRRNKVQIKDGDRIDILQQSHQFYTFTFKLVDCSGDEGQITYKVDIGKKEFVFYSKGLISKCVSDSTKLPKDIADIIQ